MVIENLWNLQSLDKTLDLRDEELHVWRASISKNEHNINYYRNLLSQDEQIQAQKYHFIKDRNCYIIARAILRSLIAIYVDRPPEKILFGYTEYGKPYLTENQGLQEIKFNLAHSKDCIVCAFTKSIDVGIDIEFINKNFNMEEVINFCCSKQEQYNLQKLSKLQKPYYFYKLWVIKEAFVKAIGLGLSYDLRQIHINFSKNKLIEPINIINNKINWTIEMFWSYNGYYSAFAIQNQVKRVSFFDLI